MLKLKRLPLYILVILFIESVIYLWALQTTDSEFVFDKCARNSGRASSAILLIILLMIGYYGLKRLFDEKNKIETLKVLIILFSINHLVHFIFVSTNFQFHSLELKVLENMHGFITFITIVIAPVILLLSKRLNTSLYAAFILYLFNTSYFIMQTFYSKITLEHPAYHNQFGILLISVTLVYILYRIFRENLQRIRTSE